MIMNYDYATNQPLFRDSSRFLERGFFGDGDTATDFDSFLRLFQHFSRSNQSVDLIQSSKGFLRML